MQIALVILYIFICYLVGLTGKNRKFGFYGYFFLSIFMTPLFGVILVLASDSRKVKETKGE